VVLVLSFIAALSSADVAAPDGGLPPPPSEEAAAISLAVPYVPQTKWLCGGAAVAMVFRYWGVAHAGIEEFEPLVDRRAHGIETNALVRAVQDRGWRATQSAGSIDMLQAELRAGRPIILLIEDRPQRYHFVVVVGIDAHRVTVHDPTWGPSRRLTRAELQRQWASTAFWSLVILPDHGERGVRLQPDLALRPDETVRLKADTTETCDDLLTSAIDRVRRGGLEYADAVLRDVVTRCPASGAPQRELAAVRFSQRRWRDAAALAERALALDPTDSYAWDLLGSSRFMQDDVRGALRAWNEVGKPRVDVVRIDGLTRTQYALVADALGLRTGTLLTAEEFERAERRLEGLPDAASARLAYRPQADGFAAVEGAVVETRTVPHGAAEWTALGVRSAVDRDVMISIPGGTGQGEVWSAGWRWWNNRPRISASFAAPHIGFLPGVWRVDASWQRETFQTRADVAVVREERLRSALTVSDWMTSRVRYEFAAGVDAWSRARFASVGGSIERLAFDDRLSLSGGATTWIPLTFASRFHAAHAAAAFRSSTMSDGTVWLAAGGLDAASAQAPLSVWEGAGEGQARAALARAHPLLTDGVITGPVFGRHLAYATSEVQHWIGASPLRLAVAAFVDVARASRRLTGAAGDPFQIDSGIGIRVKSPSQRGSLRLDLAAGLRDGSHALTIGWQY
jgi:hypothetical protein